MSLNLSNNRLYRLDDMSSIVQKAPNLKILNLSENEVRSESWVVLWVGQAKGGQGLPADGKRQGGV